MKKTLIDTNIISYYLFYKNKYPNVAQNLNLHIQNQGLIYIGTPTLYEVRWGWKDINASKKLKDFENFVKQHHVLEVTDKSTEISSDILVELRHQGITISDNDVYLAGIALEHDLELCTNNTKDFKDIPNLKLINWV